MHIILIPSYMKNLNPINTKYTFKKIKPCQYIYIPELIKLYPT